MTDQDQANAMSGIMDKLKAVENGTHVKTGTSSGGDAGAMADILRKLQKATTESTAELVTETKRNSNLGVAMNTTRTTTGVAVSRYNIDTEKKTVQEGLTKTFYYITDSDTGDVVHDNLGLFETAMGIVKHLLYTGNSDKVSRLIELDQEYIGTVMETYRHKSRLKRLDENAVQFDVTAAKYSNSKTKLQATKMKLLKAL
jgi:hypothetical protein|tara:strand:+ start:240 stop:839 length:600 start_codon:yes stop_codon:yes gene_type:complete